MTEKSKNKQNINKISNKQSNNERTKAQKVFMTIFRLILIIVGLILIGDTLLISMVSNFNLGVILPGIIGAPLLIAGLFLGFFKRLGFYPILKWAFISGYALYIVALVITCVIINSAANHTAPKDLDALIVLGAGLRGETPTRVLSTRLDEAIKYANDNPDTLLVLSGGQGEGEIIPEAVAMARYVTRRGIDESRIIVEDQSKNTRENFAFSKVLIDEALPGSEASIGFVSTGFHIYRATLVAKAQGILAYGIPSNDLWYIRPNNYLRECVAIWAYAVLGHFN